MIRDIISEYARLNLFVLILNGLKVTFPKVFDPTLRKRYADHSVVASVETTTEEPISCKARRLSPDKFWALQDELKRLCKQGVLERSQSAWSCLIVMVKKSPEAGDCEQT